MKTFKQLFFLLMLAQGAPASAQLKVTDTGIIGFGTTTPSNGFNVTMENGNRAGILHYSYGAYFRAGQGNYGNAVVGTSSDRIDFWYSPVGHNIVYAQKFEKVSDSTTKINIVPLRNGLETVLQLKTYSYEIFEGDSSSGENKTEYGFLSQEVQEILPTVTDSSQGLLLMDYDQITPFLTDATQELYYENQQQAVLIDSLAKKVADLENALFDNETGVSGSTLFQNEPNPFKENTVIRYELPSEYSSAKIMLFNMNGAYVNQFEISGVGEGELIIEGETLEAGMYLYSLIVDGKEVDTKRLILQQ